MEGVEWVIHQERPEFKKIYVNWKACILFWMTKSEDFESSAKHIGVCCTAKDGDLRADVG